MSWTTLIWSFAAGMCCMLALVHLLTWLHNRRDWASLSFVVLVAGILGLMACEWAVMHTDSPRVVEESFHAGQWFACLVTAGLLGFVHFYFGTGSRLLMTAVVVLRLLAVAANSLTGASLFLISVQKLEKTRFLGEEVSILSEWQPNPWMILGNGATLCLVVYVLNATWRFWRKGSRERRRRILVLGSSMVVYMVAAQSLASLLSTGVWRMPVLVSFPFLGLAAAMGYSLGRDLLKSAKLTSELRDHKLRLQLAAAAGKLTLWEWKVNTQDLWVSKSAPSSHDLSHGEKMDLPSFLSRVHPEDRAMLSEKITDALASTKALAADYRIILPEGGVRWITAMGQVDGDAMGHAVLIRGVSMDVTELRQSQDRFRMIVEAAPSSVILADSQGRIVMANARAEQCFGYERGDLVGRSIEELMPPQYHGAHPGLRAGFHADPSVRAMGSGRELSARRRDGSDFPVEISLSPLESPEGALVLAVIVDISARRQAEQESAMHRQELAHLARVSMLGELAGTIAHELNQPLAAMLSNSQVGVRMFESEQPDMTEIKAILDDIAADAKRAGGIIHGMRAMFKKDVVAEIQPVNMNEAVNQVLGLLHSEIVAKKAKVHLHLAKPLPLVNAGRVEIQQVLINLILNSLDAMKAAGNGNARIDIHSEHQDGHVIVTVHDSGPGISAEILKRLFEAFATSKPGGLGLGLAISHGIVKRFGGELTGENHPEGGAVFRMILPGQVA